MDPEQVLIITFFVALFNISVFGSLGRWVAVQKNRSGFEGIILGCLFGPVGAIIEALLPSGETRASRRPSSYSEDGPAPDWLQDLEPKTAERSWLKDLEASKPSGKIDLSAITDPTPKPPPEPEEPIIRVVRTPKRPTR